MLNEGEELSEKYRQMADGLQNGDESTCNIEEVKELQAKVAKIATTVDAISKKIENLDAKGDPKTKNLQDRIRKSAMNFVKETFVGLPKVPTKEELARIRAAKAQEAARRIEEEKKSAHEAKLKSESMKKSRQYSSQAHHVISNAKRQLQFNAKHNIAKNEMKLGSGFVAKAGREILEDDPIGQQIHNLKVFIQQANEAGRYEDAKTLENNLTELQEEYHKQNEQLQQNYEEFKGLFAGRRDHREDNGESNPFYEEENASNPFEIEDEDTDEYDKSGKNPFA